MKELKEIADWVGTMDRPIHAIAKVGSLPNPVFTCDGREMVSFSSNNYLGLATHPRMIKAAHAGLDRFGVANCESRILGGDMDIYRDLEAKIAKLKDKETSLIFATGYLTNLGVLSALMTSGMLSRAYGFRPSAKHRHAYFSDESNHVSIREGIRMLGAHKSTYRHCDLDDLAHKLKLSDATNKIIVTDGVFSMDGDIAPLPGILELAEQYDAMVYVDDAHGTGVLGDHGEGITGHFKVKSDRLISMGTLSKAYGAIGGFVATEGYIADILRFTCSAYGFTSTLTPDQVYAVSEAIDIVRDEPQHRRRLWANQKYFVNKIEGLGFKLVSNETCIIPVYIGDEELCETYAHALTANGFHVDAICFPAVKMGSARLRFNMHANHTREQIDRLVSVLDTLRRDNWK